MKLTRRTLLAAPAALSLSMAQKNRPAFLYIGDYTGQTNKGITMAQFHPDSGAITDMELAAETPNPTFLELHPSGRFLYAANEVSSFEGQKTGSVSAFRTDRAYGKLTSIGRWSSGGPGPCHVSVDKTGQTVLAANYGGGSVASYKIEQDGGLRGPISFHQHKGSGPVARRQDGPHAHSANATPDNNYVVVCDLGLDEIKIYKLDAAAGSIEFHDTTKLAPGSGPRHFAWHPNGKLGFSVNELLSTVTAFAWDAGQGKLKELQTIGTLDEGFTGQNSTAEIRVHPSGKWLWASNRGDDSIAGFSIDPAGKLAKIDRISTQGQVPRNFNIDPTGRWLLAANQKTNNIIVFRIDQKTGKLGQTDKGIIVGAPVCLRFLV
jgi:6-phosphogluconolactonase